MGREQKIADKKVRSQQLKKISGKKDRLIEELQDRVDTADERENALKQKLRTEIQESNMKGKVVLELKESIRGLKQYFADEQEKLEK